MTLVAGDVAQSSLNLIEKILALHDSLEAAGLPHAFGGALALAWCVGNARGTIDIDVNLFMEAGPSAAQELADALPSDIQVSAKDARSLNEDGQTRLSWQGTPVDLFLNTTDIHVEAAKCISWETFAGRRIPFLSCFHLALFKAFFNRAKDWADLEAMRDAGTLDIDAVKAKLIQYLGESDERIDRLALLNKPRT